ncbi:hypothetical protein BJX61DRAFT_377826 [Aspergillus egyptiacus]|nr:hypothetical protein BJX61DRAFT_377826 [Aspergillus egyptiacus]
MEVLLHCVCLTTVLFPAMWINFSSRHFSMIGRDSSLMSCHLPLPGLESLALSTYTPTRPQVATGVFLKPIAVSRFKYSCGYQMYSLNYLPSVVYCVSLPRGPSFCSRKVDRTENYTHPGARAA